MTLSAAFTINGTAVPASVSAAYTSTVTLALTSLSDVHTVQWSIPGTSKSTQTAPTITPAGVPSGATATFALPADPGDGLGRSFLVKCLVSDTKGRALSAYGIVGTVNSQGRMPFAAGEELARQATHGWTDDINSVLNLAAVAGGSLALTGTLSMGADPADAGRIRLSNDDDIAWEASPAGTDVIGMAVDTSEQLLIGRATGRPVNTIFDVQTSGVYAFQVNGTEVVRIASEFISVGNTPAASGALRLETGGGLNFRNNAGTGDVIGIGKNASDGITIGNSTNPGTNGVLVILPTGGTFKVFEDVAQCIQVGNEFLSIGGTPSTTGAFRLESAAEIRVRNAGNSADMRALTTDGSDALYFGASGTNGVANAVYDVKTSGLHSVRINGTPELEINSTTVDAQSNNIVTTGQIQVNIGSPILRLGLVAGSGAGSAASAGEIRLPNGTPSIQARNNADSGNVPLMSWTSSTGTVIFGDSVSTNAWVNGGSESALLVSGGYKVRCNSTGTGFNGQAPVAIPDYTVTNPSTDRAFDVSTVGTPELAAVVGTIITDLIAIGLFQ